MVRAILLTVLAAGMMGMTAQQSGCQPGQTLTVQLVNDTGRNIDFTLVYSADPHASFLDLVDDGTEVKDTVKAGKTLLEFLDCKDTGAVALELATLDVVAGVGPIVVDDSVYRIDTDWVCGDTLRYRFTSSNDLTDLDEESEVLP
jgi:hypothetical protein